MSVSYKKSKGAGAGDYYLDCTDSRTTERAKAHGDYYTNDEKEPPGVWYCGMANGSRETKLGFKHAEKFDHQNDSAQLFKNLVQGFDKNGNALTKNAGDANRVSLHDFTLSAPKSVSVAWAFADDQTKQKIAGAQQAASIKFLDFLSQYSAARTGKGGIDKVNAPLRAAMFEHASSRENDPQLHTHCVILNVAETEKKTTALQIFSMMKWQGAAASLYHADLAWRMKTMGFAIRKEGKLFEVDGVPAEVCEHFSKRRAQIKALVDKKMAAMGMDPASITASRGMLQVAALATRDQKNELTRAELQQLWNSAGAQLGFAQSEVNALINSEPALELTQEELLAEAREAVAELTQNHAVFKEPALLTAVAVRLMGRASTEKILDAVQSVKRDLYKTCPKLEKEPNTNTKDLDSTDYIYTTTEMMLLEREMLQLAYRRDEQHILKDTDLPDTLQPEQREAALWAMTDANAVTVVEGTAGAGKTFTMAAVAAAYKRNGYTVAGLSNSWSAALNLKKEAALADGRAITGWLNGVRSGKIKLDEKTCVILDEAGMSGAREMRDVLQECKNAGAKVILLGDTLQQKSVTCGDPLRVIARQNGSKRLDEIRRQKDAAQRAAVHDFFAGRAQLGLQTYIENERVKITTGEEATTAAMIADWHTARADGGSDLLIAVTKAEVRELNRLAHEKRKENGELGDSLQVKSMDVGKDSLTEFSIGDEVVIRVSKAKDEIYNRELFKIVAITDTKLQLQSAAGRAVEIDTADESWQYKDDDGEAAGLGLQHSYAITAYASQGLTVDRAFVKDSLFLKRSNAGVSMSRHRNECAVYINRETHYEAKMAAADDTEWHPIDEYTDVECLAAVGEKWSSEDVKHSTIDFENWTKKGQEFDFHAEFQAQKLELAAALAEQEISRISQASKTQQQPKIKRLAPMPFQQKTGYILPEPQENRAAAKVTIEKLAKNFIASAIVEEAYNQGAVRFDNQGLPVFCGRRPDGKLVNPVTITAPAPGAMRDRFPPVLTGNPASGFVHAVKKGIDALSLWALQDSKKILRSTVIVTAGSDAALGMPHIEAIVEASKRFVRLDLRGKDGELQELNLKSQKELIDKKYHQQVPFALGMGHNSNSHSNSQNESEVDTHQHYERPKY